MNSVASTKICEEKVVNYLLYQNPLYTFRVPLALIISIIVYGISVNKNWSKNQYITQIMIPIAALVISLVILDIVSRIGISFSGQKQQLINMCKKNNNQLRTIEKFGLNKGDSDSQTGIVIDNSVNDISDLEKHFSPPTELSEPVANDEKLFTTPLDIPYKKQNPNNKCIQPSGSCSLCSGEGNPHNLVAPIPGPQWLPQSAAAVQERLKNNDYTKSYSFP